MQAASPIAGPDCVGVDAIRARFPALARRHRGRAVAYFDGPGGTQTPRDVVDAMVDYLYYHNANTHWRYPSSVETDAMIGAARGAVVLVDGGEVAAGRAEQRGEEGEEGEGAAEDHGRPHRW